MAWGAEIRFSCRKVVFVNQPAEALSAFDAGGAQLGGEPECSTLLVRRRQVEGSMWPVAVVIRDSATSDLTRRTGILKPLSPSSTRT